MPTKNERISLVTDTEEITAVKAPPPGLILESKMLPLLEAPFPIDDLHDPDSTRPTPGMPRPQAAIVPSRTPATTAASAPGTAPARPTPPTTLVAPAPRAVVDLVRMTQTSAFLAPRVPSGLDAWEPSSPPPSRPPRSRPPRSPAGLYLGLAALLVAGGVFAGWRQWWSVRPGRIEISTTPADAVIAVGGRALGLRSPATVDEPPGSYTISITREGYARTDRTIDLQAGQQVVLAIALASLAGGGQTTAVDGAVEAAAVRPAGATVVTRRAPATGGGASTARPGTTRSAARQDSPAAPVRIMPEIIEPEQPLAREAPPAPAPSSPRAANDESRAPTAPTTMPTPTDPATASTGVGAKADSTTAIAIGASSATTSPSARTIAGRIAKAQLAIDPNADEYRVKLPPSLARAEMKLSAVVKLCVSAEGKVSEVKLLRPADPAVDAQIPVVLAKWRFRPLTAGGQPVPFCYVLQYEIASP